MNNTPKPSPKSPSATRPGADRSEPRTSPSATRPGADRTDRSVPNRKPDSADRASRSEYKPGYIQEDADGQLQQYDGKPPKNGKYIREQRDGTLQEYGPDSGKPTIDRPRRDTPRGGGRPTIDRPRLDETRGGSRPTIDRPRLPGNRSERAIGKNRNTRDF